MDTNWLPDLSQQEGPKYQVLAQSLRAAIRSGELAEGDRLPPVRELAWRLHMTPGTVSRAYAIVTGEGLLEGTVGRGTFVAARMPALGARQPMHVEIPPERLQRRGLVDLRSPQLPEVGQTEAMRQAMIRIAGQMGSDWLEYPTLRRDGPLREAMAAWVAERDLGPVTAEDIVPTSGGQHSINLVLQCCLRGERPAVLTEELSYPGFRHAIRLNRGEAVPVRLDGEGMRADQLAAACRRTGARLVIVTPEAQNPTTVCMSLDRRREIVAMARRHDLQILEDDCYSMPSTDLPSLRAMAPERVWHVTSFSKTLSAGLRAGMIVAPKGMGEAARLAAQHAFFGLAQPVSALVQDLVGSGRARALREAVNAVYARRLEIAARALAPYGPSLQPGLSFLWLAMPQGWRASTFTREAEAEGVLIRSADEYALVDGHAPNAVRIAIAGSVAEERFAAACATLARVLARPPGDLPV